MWPGARRLLSGRVCLGAYALALGAFLLDRLGPDLLFRAGPASQARAAAPGPPPPGLPAAPPAAAPPAAPPAAAAPPRGAGLPRYGDGEAKCDAGRANSACPGVFPVPVRPQPWTFGERFSQPWRQALGDRLLGVQGQLSSAQCSGFFHWGDYVWCNRAVEPPGGADVVGISFGIRERDTWAELMSNRYGVATHLYDCFYGRTNDTTKGVMGWGKQGGELTPQAVAGTPRCPPRHRHDGCFESAYQIHRVCIGTSNKNADRLAVTLASVLAGLPPLSVHLKIDAEGGEWAQLEALLQSPEDLGRIRTLDMEIHFYMDEWSAAAQCQHAEELSRKVGVVEELARVFAVAGTTLQATLEKQARAAADPAGPRRGSELDPSAGFPPKCVISSTGWNLNMYCLSFVNRRLLPA